MLDLFVAQLGQRGLNCLREPNISTPQGLRKPDTLVWSSGASWIIDVQIVADAGACTLSAAHHIKVRKYNTEAIKQYALRISGHEPRVSSLTINWRGHVAKETAATLRALGITKAQLELLVVRSLSGSTAIYAAYIGTSGGGDVS